MQHAQALQAALGASKPNSSSKCYRGPSVCNTDHESCWVDSLLLLLLGEGWREAMEEGREGGRERGEDRFRPMCNNHRSGHMHDRH